MNDEDPDRKAFIEEFEFAIKSIEDADKSTRSIISHSLNMATTIFFQSFQSVNEFESTSRERQFEYLNKLHEVETNISKEDLQSSLGLGLFKMWLTTVMKNDSELSENFYQGLKKISEEFDLSV